MGQQGNGKTGDPILTPTEVTNLTKQLKTGDTIKQISMSSSTSSALVHRNLDNTDHLYM